MIGSLPVKASGSITLTEAPEGYKLARSAEEPAPSAATALDETNNSMKYSSEGCELNGVSSGDKVNINGTTKTISGKTLK